MESLLARHRSVNLLVVLLFAQILGLAVQVKRADPSEPGRQTPLLRVWVMGVITPVEKLVVTGGHGVRNAWNDYVNLRGVREENRALKQQVEQLRIEQARFEEDAAAAHRLQALLAFKEQYVSQTVAAQVIGSSGSEQSRVLYIDKGASDGVVVDMPVITPDGVVGKVVRALPSTAQVLLITDPSWGVGGLLQKSRLQGIAKGSASGDLKFANILADEKVEVGEHVLTSGGDGIFPKGLPLATVSELLKREDMFLNIRLAPAANLSKLEEVLVLTRVEERQPTAEETANGPVRASDILSQRLPTVTKPQPAATDAAGKPVNPQPQQSQPAQKKAVASKPQTPAAGKPANPPQQQPAEPKPDETKPQTPAAGDNPR